MKQYTIKNVINTLNDINCLPIELNMQIADFLGTDEDYQFDLLLKQFEDKYKRLDKMGIDDDLKIYVLIDDFSKRFFMKLANYIGVNNYLNLHNKRKECIVINVIYFLRNFSNKTIRKPLKNFHKITLFYFYDELSRKYYFDEAEQRLIGIGRGLKRFMNSNRDVMLIATESAIHFTKKQLMQIADEMGVKYNKKSTKTQINKNIFLHRLEKHNFLYYEMMFQRGEIIKELIENIKMHH